MNRLVVLLTLISDRALGSSAQQSCATGAEKPSRDHSLLLLQHGSVEFMDIGRTEIKVAGASRHRTRSRQSVLQALVTEDRYTETPQERSEILEGALGAMSHLGFHEEELCEKSPGMLMVKIGGHKTASRNLGLYDWHPQSTLVLDAGPQLWTCITIGNSSMGLGSSFHIPVGPDKQVRIRLADLQWLKSYYNRLDIPPPACDHGDTSCEQQWSQLWHEFLSAPLNKLNKLFRLVLFGPDWDGLSKRSKKARKTAFHADTSGAYLERMGAISKVAGNPHWLSKVLSQIVALPSRALRRFKKGVDTSYCDFIELVLASHHNIEINLHVFSKSVSRCNTFNVHDHPGVFATTIVQGEHSNNIYVGQPRRIGELVGRSLAMAPTVLRAAHFERESMRYTSSGCDPHFHPQPNGFIEGPLHLAAFAGAMNNYGTSRNGDAWGIMQLAECTSDRPGDTHVLNAHWVHRPRVAPTSVHAMTAVVYDNDLDHYTLGNLGGNSYNYTLQMDNEQFRQALTNLISVLNDDHAASAQHSKHSPLQSFWRFKDGGIKKFNDPILGLTDDDNWDD